MSTCRAGHARSEYGYRYRSRWYCRECKAIAARKREKKRGREVPVMNEAEVERFLSRFDAEPNTGCWLWTGATSRAGGRWGGAGYGHMWAGGVVHLAHRLSYRYYVGPIPEKLVIDHLCQTRECVNPQHLEAVTMQENMHRGVFAQYPARMAR